MNEKDGPSLALGQPPGALKRQNNWFPRRWLWLFLLLHVAVLVCVAMILFGPAGSTAVSGAGSPGDGIRQLRTIAMELEDRSLDAQAAEAWEAFLSATPDVDNRAEILYRIGRLRFQAEQFDEAAAALVRAQLAGEGDEQLQNKIGQKLVDCLRRLGRYGEVGRELSRQVEVGGRDTGQGAVLATLAGEELTEADLDRMIQRRVDQMLQMQGAAGSETVRQDILRQFSDPKIRQDMLRELVRTELFARRARELKMDRDEEFRRARDQLEQNLLATRLENRQFEQIKPTDVDLEAYYKTNRDRYLEPESMDLALIELDQEDDPDELLAQIQSADDFRKLAKDRRAGQDDQPPTHRVVRGRQDRRLGDTAVLFELSEGQWTAEPLAHGDKRFLGLVEARTEARTPPLSEVREQVLRQYVGRKQRELSQQLLQELMVRYDVRIVPPGEPGEKPKEEDKDAGAAEQ